MNFKEFKQSLKFRKYQNWKIIIKYIEFITKNFIINVLIKINNLKSSSKKIIDLGSFRDNSYINFFLYSLKDDYNFAYSNDKNTKKLFRRIGFLNFFKYTISNSNIKKKSRIKINMNMLTKNNDEIFIDTNYFHYFYNQSNLSNRNEIIMPYFMYPRIYNSFYKKINIIKKPDFNLRIFFSGSIVEEGYNNFHWKMEPKKFPNRIKIINRILEEFKSEIYLIKSKKDLKTIDFSKKKIIFCLHDKMIKKTSYILNFKENFTLLSKSCFNLSCPGVVMPLCHHLIEGIKVGSIPITNCEKLLYPNLNNDNCLRYSSLEELIEKIDQALHMDNDRVQYMRSKVQEYYETNLSPKKFKQKFNEMIVEKKNKIICCDDHRSINKFI